jgi:signal transduction histidine kinase
MKIGVRSIFAKVVLWFVATVALAVAGYLATSMVLSARIFGRDAYLPRLTSLFVDDARRAFEEGGPGRLDTYLRRLNEYSDAEHYLVDRHGTDLVTGEDRSALLARQPQMPRTARVVPWMARNPQGVRVRSSDDRRYRLVTVFAPPTRVSPWEALAYFAWFPVLVAVLCYVLAVHLASPLRNLRGVVERFGRGDLGSRCHLTRQDEIGELASSFNRMADQITTLLSAERRLLQDVSHELRSPLARLGFAIELARTNNDRDAALSRIRKEADRLNHLVGELLKLTRAEGDPTARSFEPMPIHGLLDELVTDCNLEAEAKGCRIVAKLGAGAIVTGDRELLRRACENVLRNAIRYAPEGTEIDVGLTTTNGLAEISVRDRGPGVSREALVEIFKPFYRVEDDRDRSSGGAGLGLAIAHRAVELHHGKMAARNAEPGLCVTIELATQGADEHPAR